MKTFLGITSMTALVALSLTPEMSTGLAILVAAFFAGVTSMFTAMYTARTARMVAIREMTKVIAPVAQQLAELAPVVALVPEVAKKIDELVPVVAKIDGHVDSEKTRAEGESAALKKQIEFQREMIEEMKKSTALLAQARATSDISTAIVAAAGVVQAPVPTPAIVPVPPSTAPILKRIETNTSETAKNTATTDENVQALKDQA